MPSRPLPYAPTAILPTMVYNHLGIAQKGKILFLFPRGVPYIYVKRLADKMPGAHIRLVKVRATYEILPENEYYDTSASV